LKGWDSVADTEVKIKICGLRRPEDIEAVNVLKPDYCGFITEVPGSRRSVSRETLRRLVRQLKPDIIPVGVFVDAPAGLAAQLLNEGVISMAQLHGHENEDDIVMLRAITGKPVIKAFSVRCARDVAAAQASPADYILLDHGSGGTGKTFDWSLVREIERPFFLAGGLCPENLKMAIESVRPWAVDMSSGLETAGYKDFEKMRAAVAIVRRHSDGCRNGE